MTTIRILTAACFIASTLSAQSLQIYNPKLTGVADASTASAFYPPVFSSLPSTCAVGAVFWVTGTPAVLYDCPALNTPNVIGSGSGTNAITVNGAAVPASAPCLGTDSSSRLVSTSPCQPAGNETVSCTATPTFSTLTYSSYVALSCNITSFTLAAGFDGQRKVLTFQQSSGAWGVLPPSNVHGFFTVGTLNGGFNSQTFTYYATPAAWVADSPGVTNK